MSASKTKFLVAALVSLGAVSTAQAGFVTIDSTSPVQNTIGIVPSNDFRTIFAGLGVTTYTLGASLAVDAAGSIEYFYYGKEAGYKNVFTAGLLSYDSGYTPTTQNYFGAPISIGSQSVGAGILNFGFCAYSYPGTNQGCVSNAQNDHLNLGSTQSIAYSLRGDTAWLFWDDSGAGPDDNHDDMLIKAVFTPKAVPEPATLGLFGLGLLGVWTSTRRRDRKA
jgi:hypothetical protein